MLYALMCDDAAAGGHAVRTAVNDTLANWAGTTVSDQPAAAPQRPAPDPATWGLQPHQVGRAEAAQRLGAGS